MARTRYIKPAFFTNDDLAEFNSPLGRLLFIGLWTLADCNGNLEWRAKRIKAALLPYDECNIEELAINLDKSGFVRFYSIQGKKYLNITNFTKHQHVHKNELKSGSDIPMYASTINGTTINSDVENNLDQNGTNLVFNGINPPFNLEPLTFNLEPLTYNFETKNSQNAKAHSGNTTNSKVVQLKPNSEKQKTEEALPRATKPQVFKDLFAAYPATRKGGTDTSAWKVWKSEKLTEQDAEHALQWLKDAALANEDWRVDSQCPFIKGIVKFIRERIWLTPLPIKYQQAVGHSLHVPSYQDVSDGDYCSSFKEVEV